MYYTINKRRNIVGFVIENNLDDIPDFLRKEYEWIDIVEFLKDCTSDEEKIERIFSNVSGYYEYYFTNNLFVIEISWGDWKHDHRFCDELMRSVGYKLVNENVTEEDGSDCYSAIRTYRKEK